MSSSLGLCRGYRPSYDVQYPHALSKSAFQVLQSLTSFFTVIGWGAGCHPCPGMRWAKLQQTLSLAYALAKFKWSGCHADGSPNPIFDRKEDKVPANAALPQGLYCKYIPREEI